MGQKLQPLNVVIKNGVATYEKWTVPLGEYNVETEGTVDLVHRTMDVVTWLPLGSLTEQALTATKSIGGYGAIVLDAATMVPFRTKGSLDKPTTALDTSLFAKTVAKQISPGDLLKKGAGDLLKNKIPGLK